MRGHFNRQLLLFLGSVLVISLLAAACGSESEGPSVSVETLEDRVTNIFRNASPAVVHVTSIILDEDEQMQPLPPQAATGTGFIVDKEGHIITNNHVIAGATEVRVTWANGQTADARVVGTDPSTDLAVLKIDIPISDDMIVTMGDSDDLEVGNLAVAIGSPFGFQQTLTFGVISALGRTLQASDGYGTVIQGIIQTDTVINPGNSGGPLFNSSGNVVGVTTAIFTMGGSFEGIGFVIPINTVKKVLPVLIEQGFILRPSLGIFGVALSPGRSQFLGLMVDQGLLIQKVRSGSTGEAAGLRAGTTAVETPIGSVLVDGDILIEFGGELVDSMATLDGLVKQHEVGDEVELVIIREGQQITLSVIIGQLTTAESGG